MEGEKNPFTSFYGQLLHQGNMLQDSVRTGMYQKFIYENPSNFAGKVVLDVGTGTGILAFFAIHAGARKVYAVDASESTTIAQLLADANGYSDRIIVIRGKIEELKLPERVDVIISEPIGFLLVHERMLESYVLARDRFLKSDGHMFPSSGSIVFSPLSDEALHKDQLSKVSFWNNKNFYGVNIAPALERATQECFSQPIVGNFSIDSLISSQRAVHTIDFNTVGIDELQIFEIPFSLRIDTTCLMHGFGCWFDISFFGSDSHVVLTTAPDAPGTHWYQCRLLLRKPIAVNEGQYVVGSMRFEVNNKFSYDIHVSVTIDGTNVSSHNSINLADQVFSYLGNV